MELLALLDHPRLDQRSLVDAFLREPVYGRNFSHGFGTLYTAVLRPTERPVEYHWPGTSFTFDRRVPGG